uniref:HEAT repeat-containing protein 2 n=1 Tax=Pyxicephalus adspersus TaxID=30357 RepID=A0AAV3A529_PYXAD|nr:TPA: hypothetical protein GDO54_015320 [Pyxicephalus adspersus]
MAAEGEQRAASEVSQAVARHLNCLNDDNKNTRKRALVAIQKEAEDKRLGSAALQEVFGELLKPLLKSLSDPMEKCRELSIQTISYCVTNVPRPEEALPYLIPTITQRLGSLEIMEPSEELRLALAELLYLLVEICGKKLAPYLDEMMRILQRTIIDPFPDVKKESCKCAANYAKSIPGRVRQAVTVVVGTWLLELRDRYLHVGLDPDQTSYLSKILAHGWLALSRFKYRQIALDYWKKIGMQWERENEDDLKDKMDFSDPSPSIYPSGVERPGLGCRELVFRNLSKILPAVSHDITDWVAGTRIKASQLLVVLLLHAEDHTTQHMELVLSTLYISCLDEEGKVVHNSVKAAELIGTFVNPEVFLKLLLQALQKSPLASHLMILAAFIRGSSKEVLKPHLLRIADAISQTDICQRSEKVLYLEQLLCCLQSLISICQQYCADISLHCMKVLITILASPASENLYEKVQGVMMSLAEIQGLNGAQDLYRQHMQPLMQWASESHEQWTSFSIERAQYEVLVSESGPVIGENLDLLIPVLKNCLQPTKDPQMRLKVFTMLSKLLLKPSETVNSKGQFHLQSETIIKEILVPNLKWQAGRTAAAIRTIAVSCLWVLFQSEVLSSQEILQVQDIVMPTMLTTLEEDSKISRLMSCRIIRALLDASEHHLDPDTLNKIYLDLLKRLDDASDEVRITAAKTLDVWFKCIDDRYDRTTYKAHLEFLYRGLLVHLDDPDTNLQTTVLDVLKEASTVYPSLLVQEIEAVKHKHRTAAYCDQLLRHIQLNKDSSQTDST